MRHLPATVRHSASGPHECRLIMLCPIAAPMESLRGLGSEGLGEYMSTQHAPVVWVL